MVASNSTASTDETPEVKTEVVEKRVGSTVIRRRTRKQVDKPDPVEEPTVAAESAVESESAPVTEETQNEISVAAESETTKKVKVDAPETKVISTPATKSSDEDSETEAVASAHKPLRKKKSRAEWESEDIRRAGGLKHYVVQTSIDDDEEDKSVVTTEIETTEIAEEVVPAVAKPVIAKPIVKAKQVTQIPGARVERVFRPSGSRRKRSIRRDLRKTQVTNLKESKRVIRMDEKISVSELSQQLGVKAKELIKQLFELEIRATVNETVDIETASVIAEEYGFTVEFVGVKENDLLAALSPDAQKTDEERSTNTESRPPVVTVMGHVDHGKTSILDAVRKSNVADGEAGGITQHIGASEVATDKGVITFLDTPGHEAFTALRSRGAKVTDLVVLVVSADDGVMPQTREAIDHAKAAGVPIIVAINKIDKPEANPERIKRELSENGVVTEEWGGDAICVETSAKTGKGIDQLLEMIHLQAEVLELKANSKKAASGTVIESKLDKGRGPVATILIQNGTLHKGKSVVCGTCYGRVRSLTDPFGKQLKEVGPGHAAEIVGLNGVPVSGDAVIEATDDKSAKTVAESRKRKEREDELNSSSRISLEMFQQQLTQGEVKTLNIIIKADVQGSAEAVADSLAKIDSEKVNIKVILRGVGGVTESDVLLAAASQAIVIGFNVAPESKARRVAELKKVEIKNYSIIYELIDDIKKAMAGLLAPQRDEKVLGQAAVREVFNVSKVGSIAGCLVTEGSVQRNAYARLLRDSTIVFEGKIISLKRFKDDAKEVKESFECGIGLDGFNDIKPGDIIEAYIIEERAATL